MLAQFNRIKLNVFSTSIYISLYIIRLSKDQSGYNFDFRLLYKVLPREMAVVRFGGIKRQGKCGYVFLKEYLHTSHYIISIVLMRYEFTASYLQVQ